MNQKPNKDSRNLDSPKDHKTPNQAIQNIPQDNTITVDEMLFKILLAFNEW